MLGFERRVVAAMTEGTDPPQREEIRGFVEGTLATMPEHLRAAVAVASVGLGAIARVGDLIARNNARGPDPVVSRLTHVRFGPLQQYFRLFRSLVVFAEHETSPEPST